MDFCLLTFFLGTFWKNLVRGGPGGGIPPEQNISVTGDFDAFPNTTHLSLELVFAHFVGCILNSVTEAKDKCSPETGLGAFPTVSTLYVLYPQMSF